jgi:hypothetical protein
MYSFASFKIKRAPKSKLLIKLKTTFSNLENADNFNEKILV